MKGIQYTAFSEAGLRMKENQDSLFCGVSGTSGLFLVSDGMGGHENGAWASRTIINKASAWWDSYQISMEKSDFLKSVHQLKEVFSDANREIYSKTEKNFICGATLTALWIEKNAWAVFSCGDSRCYETQGGILKRRFFQLTRDDVWENQLENVRGMTRQEILANKNYGLLVRAVGVQSQFQCSIQSNQCRERTLFLLCSDGIYKYCSHEILKKAAFCGVRGWDLKAASAEIIRQVFLNGAGDNLSLVLVRANK